MIEGETDDASLIVTPGELISSDASNFLGGHGTYTRRNKLYSCVCGRVNRVNRLVTVQPVHSRYVGDVGDVVVGRVTRVVEGKYWQVDIQAQNDARLLLSSVTGIQRRDESGSTIPASELDMRELFSEHDVIVAEVQQIYSRDNQCALQTRSQRYGKLETGVLVGVNSSLVKRCKQHFHTFDFGTRIVLGKNGFVWVSKASKAEREQMEKLFENREQVLYASRATTSTSASSAESRRVRVDADGDAIVADDSAGSSEPGDSSGEFLTLQDRDWICRVRNAVLALARERIQVFPETILDVVRSSKQVQAKEMLGSSGLVCEEARKRVERLNLEQAMREDEAAEEEFLFQVGEVDQSSRERPRRW